MKSLQLIKAGSIATGAVAIGAIGGTLMSGLVANADTATTTATTTTVSTSPSPSSTPSAQTDQSQGAHTANGITETVLTGDTATKAKAAALAAVPGATVIRAETDAEGAAYEVHLTKSDGSQVTVKLDSNFNVTTTEAGM